MAITVTSFSIRPRRGLLIYFYYYGEAWIFVDVTRRFFSDAVTFVVYINSANGVNFTQNRSE